MNRGIAGAAVCIVLACMLAAIIWVYPRTSATQNRSDFRAVQIGWTTDQVRERYGEPQKHHDAGAETEWEYFSATRLRMLLKFYDRHVQSVIVMQQMGEDVLDLRPVRFVDAQHPIDAENEPVLKAAQADYDANAKRHGARLDAPQPIP